MLTELPVGADARVVWVHDSSPVGERLMEMGVVPGAPIRVVRKSGARDPLQIRIRSYVLSLRPSEAASIEVD